MTIPGEEIIASAKALAKEIRPDCDWYEIGPAWRWNFMWEAYAALRAAREARK